MRSEKLANSRHRSYDGRVVVSGLYQTFPPFPSQNIQSGSVGEYGTCDDQVCGYKEPRLDHTFLSVQSSVQYPTFSGTKYNSDGSPAKRLSNCIADFRPNPPSPTSKYPPLTTVEQSNLAWESLAATNPNVAHVSLPSYWAELKDLPSLWRQWGDSALGRAEELWRSATIKGSKSNISRSLRTLFDHVKNPSNADIKKALSSNPEAYLWYRWGLAPLVSDIRNMFKFTEAVNQRIQWLNRLQTGDRLLKRRATLRNTSGSDAPTTVTIKSNGAFIQGRRTVTYSEKMWCTVKWKLVSDYKISGVGLDFDPLWVKANQLTFGLTYHEALAALWQVMPWSWFADWFLKISTIIDATNNTVPLTWASICLMQETHGSAETIESLNSADLAWCKPSGYNRQTEVRKRRLIVSPILPFVLPTVPVFTTGQWSILGALAVLSQLKR
jgi:hypothetical protein